MGGITVTKRTIGIRLREIGSLDINFKGFMNGDELVARSWAKYLQMREDVARVDLYGKEGPVAPDLDLLIHFNPETELSQSLRNIIYLQNAFRKDSHDGGTLGVFQRCAHNYAGFLFTSPELMAACATDGAVIPFATDPLMFYPQPAGTYRFPTSFVGNNIRSDEVTLRYLSEALPFGLVIYGSNWGYQPFLSAWRGKLPMEDLATLYSDSCINLNCHLAEHVEMNLINLRIYDILACGGFVLSDKVLAIEATFGDAVAVTDGYCDLWAALAEFSGNPAERKRRALVGRHIVLSNHTYKQRVAELMRYLHQL